MLVVIYELDGTKKIETLDWTGMGDPIPCLKKKYQTDKVWCKKIQAPPTEERIKIAEDILANK